MPSVMSCRNLSWWKHVLFPRLAPFTIYNSYLIATTCIFTVIVTILERTPIKLVESPLPTSISPSPELSPGPRTLSEQRQVPSGTIALLYDCTWEDSPVIWLPYLPLPRIRYLWRAAHISLVVLSWLTRGVRFRSRLSHNGCATERRT